MVNDYVIAVDFDGTCVEHKYPEVGKDVPHAVETLRWLLDNQCNLILYTMRSGVHLEDAVNWFASKRLPLWGVQVNPQQHEWTTSRKCYAQIYIDDAACGCPLIYPKSMGNDRPYVDWLGVREWLETHK